jgi:hypothetical protein
MNINSGLEASSDKIALIRRLQKLKKKKCKFSPDTENS